jgi:hypothetical protein
METNFMRGTILGLTGFLLLGSAFPADPPASTVAQDEQVLKNAHVATDTEGLLKFFQKRTLAEGDRDKVKALIGQLGSDVFRLREQALTELIARGPAVVEMLKVALSHDDLEIVRRAELCLARIQETDYSIDVPSAAARLLAHHKPAGAVEMLLAFLPFTGNEAVNEEVRFALAKLAVIKGTTNKTLVDCLTSKDAWKRATAGEALVRGGAADMLPAVKKLLADPEPTVRFRTAQALAFAKDAEAVPVLIDLMGVVKFPLVQAWKAEDILFRLAEGKKPPAVSLGNTEETRKNCRDAWAAWWKDNGSKIDLAQLKKTTPLLGYTLVVLLDEGQVAELNSDKKPRWQIEGLAFPLDAQLLPNDRVLVAEYNASKVAERNLKGEVLWEKRIFGPLAVQRLANGNTFVATDSVLYEFDAKGKEVSALTIPGERIMKAARLPTGESVCLTTEERVVRLDAAGKEVSSFPVKIATKLFGGKLHVLSNGHVLVPLNAEDRVVEFNGAGEKVWEAKVEQPITATRLANGNTLVTSMLPTKGAMEFDRYGNMVWQFKTNTRVTRAFRR